MPDGYASVAEFGARDVNGGVRDMLDPAASYVGVDIGAGPGIDVVADAAVWRPVDPVDLVLCLEVFEHTPAWREITVNAYGCLAAGGTFIGTAAGPGRAPHSAASEAPIAAGEYYGNVDPGDLEAMLVSAGFVDVRVDVAGSDVRWVGVRDGV